MNSRVQKTRSVSPVDAGASSLLISEWDLIQWTPLMDIDENEVLDYQSGVVSFSEASSMIKSEITGFTDQNPSYMTTVESQPDSTFGQADMTDVSLAEFLSRPVRIKAFEWQTNAPEIYERFNPWKDFFSEPRIANRIAHYAYLRCKLRIKVLLNGNAFHYGRAIMSYIPIPDVDQLTTDRLWVQQDIIAASQRPHIYLDPTYSQGGEMSLPFFYYKNAVSIPSAEYDALGELVLHTINKLKHANGAEDKVTINVFAWAEDVTLFAPTNAVSGDLSPQSGELSPDEYGLGPVSKPATIVARAAHKLSSIPAISPYARATEIAAAGIAKVASLLGYCRPNDIGTIQSYKPLYGGNMANTNVEDTCHKLSVDAKQEVTIDPRTVGLGSTDEMAISTVCSKESYLTTFDWQVADNQDTPLFSIAVSPMQWGQYNGSLGKEYHLTPLGVCASLFQYWRGEIEFRFQVVASQYHRGRIRITYEPFDTSVSTNYTENYNWIMDIAEKKDMTVKVGWARERPYMQCVQLAAATTPDYGPAYSQVAGSAFNNGMLTISVVNDLTVPNSVTNNDVQVNVFVKSNNIEFAAPYTSSIENLATRQVIPEPPLLEESLDFQSGEVNDMESPAQPSAPETTIVDTSMAKDVDIEDYTNHVFFGESITSLRTLLKRYNFLGSTFPSGTLKGKWRVQRTAFPAYRGPDDVTGVTHQSGYVNNTALAFLAPAYTAWRGNIRHKIFFITPTDNVGSDLIQQVSNFVAYRSNRPTIQDGRNYRNVVTAQDYEAGGTTSMATLLSPSYVEGLTAQPSAKNNVVEIEVPFYMPARFYPTKVSPTVRFPTSTATTILQSPPLYNTEASVNLATDGAMVHTLDYVATGEDFSMFFWTGMPPLYFVTNLGS